MYLVDLATGMAESNELFSQGLPQQRKKLTIPTNYMARIPWQERERLLEGA